ncbi:agamous-like MADS-box protein AGL82 [Eucalyptus grandis]|uniref:agamous-like MADS-box protein AGL82 n=1 Tax=Eucalyptus grandis TaxID=71139 RepID=UPI00192EBC5A|nr:agamous-like MADS-box protein AGL82 [Eucalyptus grandis]
MDRRKLTLGLIPNEKARRITYEKRKKNVMKKAQEFATLCDLDTCMIIYGPTGSATATEPEVWPASPGKVKRIIERYMSEGADRCAKRTVRLPEFFANRERKVDAELTEALPANRKAKYPVSESLIAGLSKEDLKRLLNSLGHKLEAAKARLAVMKEDAVRTSSSYMNDRQVHANERIYDQHQMQGSFQDPSSPDGTPNFRACYNASMVQPAHPRAALPDAGRSVPDLDNAGSFQDHSSPEGTPSFGAGSNALMVQPARPHAALGDAGRPLPDLNEACSFQDHSSPEGTPSFRAGYDASMVQPAHPRAALSDAGRPVPDLNDAGSFQDHSSLEGTPSFRAGYNASMVQPARPRDALGDAGRPVPDLNDAGSPCIIA